jgi:Lipid A 3-O-deacylase (PagL).
LEDNLGTLFVGEDSNFIFTPSFGAGFYDDGDGKKLGNDIQFRTTFEFSYELKNKNRIGISYGHISNANLGDKNPGVEILSLSFQVPFN